MLAFDNQISVMGVLNVTPDSFFDGGKFQSVELAVRQAKDMLAAGATILDVGGESTRPGASEVSVDEEIGRVLPVIKEIRNESDCLISIDTSKPEVMREAVNAGASMINDVRALSAPGALSEAISLAVPVCLMHMQGNPGTMQNKPEYGNVVEEVVGFFQQRIKLCTDAGLKNENIVIDPGFGFGKSLAHNLSLLKHLSVFTSLNYPVLVGMSRKSMLGQLLDVPTEERLAGSLALAGLAITNGARIIRVHDVKETVHVAKVCNAVLNAK